MTQAELGHLAQVSLPTVQILEAGKANPSLSTLKRLLHALGLDLAIVPEPADWNLLSHLGLPLTSEKRPTTHPEEMALVRQLRLAAFELRGDDDPGRDLRKRDSLQALFLALKTQFPGFYARHFKRSPLIDFIESRPISGRIIKLKRIAASALSEYL